MKCRIQIRLTESNYWEKKIPYSLGKKHQNPDTAYVNILSTSSHSDMLCPPPSPPFFSLSLYYLPLLFGPGTQVLGNFLSLSFFLPIGFSYLRFYFSPIFLHFFASFSSSCCVCYMCGRKRWLFPPYYHQWGLIYDSHGVESPIKSLFTVKRQDHQKQ